jgi:hypothetical protein
MSSSPSKSSSVAACEDPGVLLFPADEPGRDVSGVDVGDSPLPFELDLDSPLPPIAQAGGAGWVLDASMASPTAPCAPEC